MPPAATARVRLRIDEVPVAAPAGGTVLEAARRAGVDVPVLCFHPALPPDGSCRVCVVEVAGRAGLHPACVLPVAEGLDIRTETPRVRAARRHVLGLLLADYQPGIGREPNEFLALVARYGLPPPAEREAVGKSLDEGNPFIRVDRDACIHCWRCVRACDRLNGVAAIGVFGRGTGVHIGFGLDGPMHDSTCEFCGMCEAVCPTDALTLRQSPGSLPAPAHRKYDLQLLRGGLPAEPRAGGWADRRRQPGLERARLPWAPVRKGSLRLGLRPAEAPANLLTHAALDPVAKIPEYKVCAVAVEPADADPRTGSAAGPAP